MDNAESEVAILILESTWLIADNVSVHARTDNTEFINSSCHSKLEMSPRQLLIHILRASVKKNANRPYISVTQCTSLQKKFTGSQRKTQ